MRSRALWRVRHYVAPWSRTIALVFVSAAISIGAAMALPMIIKAAIDGPITNGDRGGLWALAGLALVLAVAENGFTWVRRRRLMRMATGIETAIRNDLYRHMQRLHVGFHDQWQSGQLVQRIISDISSIRRFAGFGSIFLVIISVETLVVLALLVNLHTVLGLLVAAVVATILPLTARFERRFRSVARQVQDQEGDLTTLVEEGAVGLRTIKAFGRARLVGGRFHAESDQLHGTNMEKVELLTRFSWVLGFVPNLAVAGVLLVGAFAVGDGGLTVGGLVAFVLYVMLLVHPMEALGWIIAIAEEAETAAERIFEVFDTEPAVDERPGALTVPEVRGEIRFEGVRFSYPGTAGEVLRGVDLVVEPGETVALVGATGSGKTTLVNLVPRLYDVSDGRVTIDGHDVRDLTLPSLRSHVGVAFEDPTLFSASVRENLTFGRPDATDDEVAEALAVAQAGFVHDLPWGLDTRIGEQGLSLSGGQRQRLALARAILGRPDILVLDDPLSALDVHTEALVEEALRRVLEGRTALLVVHRPSTVALADRAALLHDGRIVASGTHSELMRDQPLYRSLLAQEAEDLSSSTMSEATA